MTPWWLRLSRYARPQAQGISSLMAVMLSSIALDALKPWPMKLIVDSVFSGRPLPAAVSWMRLLPGAGTAAALLGWLTVGTILVFLAGWSSRVLQAYLQAGVGNRMMYELAADVFSYLQSLSLRFHGLKPAGDLVKRVTTDTRCVRELLMSVFLPAISSGITVAVMFAIMWRLDRSLSLLAISAAPLLALGIWLLAGKMEARSYEQMELQGQAMSLAEQTLTALPVVRAFGREYYHDRQFSDLCRGSDRAYLRLTSSELQFKIGTDSITALGTAAVMGLGGLHVIEGKLSIGSLLVFVSYLASLYSPLETLAYLSQSFASASAGARRVFEVLETEDMVRDAPGAKPLPLRPREQCGHIRLESVTFGYGKNRPVLNGVTLEARPGEAIALVGPTGAGKTTLVSLIPRFFDPCEGRVLFDGVDVKHVKLSSLRAQVALVLQEPFLLPLTIAENISYGRPEASREDIAKAAAAANAAGFIDQLPAGYETIVGERGTTLSGGERQRLAIARAFLKNAPVLILDEPTSALDSQTESLILEALRRLMQGRTTFIIAHRLSTIRHCDRIIVLEDGKVVESGPHCDLITAGGLYSRFYELQFGPAARVGSPAA